MGDNGRSGATGNGHSSSQQQGDYRHPMSIEEFRKRGYEMVDWICDYHSRVKTMPVRSQVSPGYLAPLLPREAPENGEAWPQIMADVESHIMPGITHWQSPNFFAYFPANSSLPGILGEMMSAAFNTIGFSWMGNPAATELETIVMDWLAKLLNLPAAFLSQGKGGGVIQGTASEADVVVLLAARAQSLAQEGRTHADQNRLVVYSSDQAHSSIKKACMITGTLHCRLLPTHAANDWGLTGETLETAIKEDLKKGLLPSFVTATIGTTSTCAVDDIPALAAVCQRFGLWLHIDAAYAGTSAVLPEERHHFVGVDGCHSYSTNMHKALLVNFDCCALWVKDSGPLKEALSLTPAYLRAKGNALDYKDWQLPLGRRFRALKLWFVLRTYGTSGLQEYIRHHHRLAAHFTTLLQNDCRFAVAAPPRFGLICFRVKAASDETNMAILEKVNASGKIFLVHTEVGTGENKQLLIRMAIGGTNTQLRHVVAAWQAIQDAADDELSTSGPV